MATSCQRRQAQAIQRAEGIASRSTTLPCVRCDIFQCLRKRLRAKRLLCGGSALPFTVRPQHEKTSVEEQSISATMPYVSSSINECCTIGLALGRAAPCVTIRWIVRVVQLVLCASLRAAIPTAFLVPHQGNRSEVGPDHLPVIYSCSPKLYSISLTLSAWQFA